MKKQFFSKQVCSLLIAPACLLLPTATLQAAEASITLADDVRWVAPEGYFRSHGQSFSAGSVMMLHGYSSGVPEGYSGFMADRHSSGVGAQGPIRDDPFTVSDKREDLTGKTAGVPEAYEGFKPERK